MFVCAYGSGSEKEMRLLTECLEDLNAKVGEVPIREMGIWRVPNVNNNGEGLVELLAEKERVI